MKGLIVVLLVFVSTNLYAQQKGGSSFGFLFGLAINDQSDMNTVGEGFSDSPELGNALELGGFYQYRFSGTMWALQFRPSYAWQSDGGLSASALMFMPMARMYPLQSSVLGLFMQLGIGFGFGSGEIDETGGNKVEFSGSTQGYMIGLGIDICFTKNHCMTFEGNVRSMLFDRLISDSSGGNPTGISSGGTSGQEVERSDTDLFMTFSGLQTNLGYVYYF